MPMAPGTVCSTPGCGGVRRDGICNRCGPKRRQYQRQHDASRGNAASRGYDAAWQHFRESFLSSVADDGHSNALCRDCAEQDIVTAAVEVHHIVKVKDDTSRRLDPTNCLPLCKPHHSARTARGE
jgi:5-methylcytosine-specific restriction protein A